MSNKTPRRNLKASGKNLTFTEGNQHDANFQAGQQKYINPMATRFPLGFIKLR